MAHMSDYPITFHYMTVDDMYNMEFFTYHLRPYGIINHPQDLNRPPPPKASPSTTTLTPQGDIKDLAQEDNTISQNERDVQDKRVYS